MKLKLLIAAPVFATALFLAGCQSGDTTADSTSSTTGATTSTTGGKPASGGKSLKITVIAKSQSNPVFPVANTGALAAAKEESAKTGWNISIDWQTPANEDAQEQANRIKAAVAGGSGAILISCSDAAKVTGAINDAVTAGVPVMTFDSDAPDSKRFAYYGADDADCGTQVMDQLAKVLNGKGSIAILAGNQNAPNLQKRVKAVQEEAKKFPGITIVTVANHVETPDDATAKVKSVMSANPQINGWAMIGGWPLFAKGLLTDLDPNKVKVVSVDALPAELDYVDKGIAPVLLAQPIYEWGHTSVEMIVDKIINKKDVPVINKMPLVPVTKDSLGTWARTLQKWGMTGIDPKYLAMPDKKA